MPPAGRRRLAHRRAIDRDRVGQPFLARREAVTGERTFREDDEPSARRRRLREPVEDPLEVRLEPPELRLHLNGGHARPAGESLSIVARLDVAADRRADRKTVRLKPTDVSVDKLTSVLSLTYDCDPIISRA